MDNQVLESTTPLTDRLIEGLVQIATSVAVFLITAWIISVIWNYFATPFTSLKLRPVEVAAGGLILRWIGHRLGLDN